MGLLSRFCQQSLWLKLDALSGWTEIHKTFRFSQAGLDHKVAKSSKLKYNSWLLKLLLIIGDLLRFLQNRQPEDAFCIVGITMIDLYPKESWNFVFGQASLSMGMVFVNIGFCIANYVNTYIGIQDIMYCIVNQSKGQTQCNTFSTLRKSNKFADL